MHNLILKKSAKLIFFSKSNIYKCSPPYCIVACYATVIGLRGQHHVELRFIGSSLSFIPGVEGQAQRVVITQVNLGSVTERGESSHCHFFCVCVSCTVQSNSNPSVSFTLRGCLFKLENVYFCKTWQTSGHLINT